MTSQPDEIDRIVEAGDDADDVLRAVVAELVARPGTVWAGISFLENGVLELGPEAGAPDTARRTAVEIAWRDTPVGELAVDGDADRVLLEGVAARIAEHVLLGWDTGGESWEP